MNPDPSFAAAHMRARMHGFIHAHCWNCMYFEIELEYEGEDEKEGWCKFYVSDPLPKKHMYETVCTEHEPGTRDFLDTII